MAHEQKIGLALSGGGARAMAFHLGCMRALHDRGILTRVSVLSSVSGGSVIGALWAYSDGSFEDFEVEVRQYLKKGFTKGILIQSVFSIETPKILGTVLVSGTAALVSSLLSLINRVARLASIRLPGVAWVIKFIETRFVDLRAARRPLRDFFANLFLAMFD